MGAATLVGALVVTGLTSDASGGAGTDPTTVAPTTVVQHQNPRADEPGTPDAPGDEVPGPRLRRPAKPAKDLVRPPRPERTGVTEAVREVVGYTGRREHRFKFPGAEYVKIHFSRLAVVPGDKVMVTDASGTEVHSYRADPRVLSLPGDSPVTYDESSGFWAMSVHGDTAVVKLDSTAERLTGSTGLADLTSYGFAIDRVAHGVTGAEKTPAGPGSEESVCGGDDMADVACYESDYPTEYRHSRAVARLLINGTSLCTAFRVGSRNRMLTNHHCFSQAGQARNTEVWFGYECRACDDHTVGRVTKVVGSDVLGTDRQLDYTLFTVSDFGSVRDYGYLELATGRADRGEKVYIPQHPDGDRRQIAMDSDADSEGACQVEDPRYDGYFDGSDVAYRCDTAPGSSGAPVLSRESDKVLALHHFGGCPNSGVRGDLLHDEIGDQV